MLIKKLIPKKIRNLRHLWYAWYGAIKYRQPSKKLLVIGVTGTSGKSTSVFFLRQMLEFAGYKVGSLSTIDFYINGELNWGIELLRKGNKIEEHMKRFEEGGKYYDLIKENRVIDFRRGKQTNVKRYDNRVTVFFPKDDFSNCSCLFGNDKNIKQIDLLP